MPSSTPCVLEAYVFVMKALVLPQAMDPFERCGVVTCQICNKHRRLHIARDTLKWISIKPRRFLDWLKEFLLNNETFQSLLQEGVDLEAQLEDVADWHGVMLSLIHI